MGIMGAAGVVAVSVVLLWMVVVAIDSSVARMLLLAPSSGARTGASFAALDITVMAPIGPLGDHIQ